MPGCIFLYPLFPWFFFLPHVVAVCNGDRIFVVLFYTSCTGYCGLSYFMTDDCVANRTRALLCNRTSN